ncbi:MAG: hypothetical protein OEM15_09260 [Myxococcales bacterium]|nr:hypothetical protein [Myxococcales bacterium]MDH3485698.1 hypothetical protein [Myxococcales bacterium]
MAGTKSELHEDVALLCSRSEDGRSYGILRRRKEEIQVGTLRALEEGKPIHGEIVSLRPRSDSPMLFDVETEHVMTPARTASGPPKISTKEYREGWDSIWSEKSGSRALN